MTHDPRDLRDRLRTATAVAHQRLEAALDLLAEPCERARFVELLKRFRSFHFAWEPALAQVLPADAAMLAARRKLPLIDADLLALDVAQADIDALRDAPFAAGLCRDVPSALGSFYVLEGSTLGGRFISRHLSRVAAGWLPSAGLRYFDPYGDAASARWKETMARLDAVPSVQWPRVEAGGVRAFDGLHAWLTGAPMPRPSEAATA